MVGSLDCLHIPWRNCPIAYQGSFSGSKGRPTIILEASANYDLWFWHALFGYPGALNNINVLDSSPLHASFINGEYERDINFDFEIGGKLFRRLYHLIDGIYPKLSWFVKTKSVPTNPMEQYFALWQESCWKDIKRAFGVLVQRFMLLDIGFDMWHLHSIKYVIATCLILHNMMVEERLHNDIDIFDFDATLHNTFIDDNVGNEAAPMVTEIELAANKAELQQQEALLRQVQERNNDIFDLDIRME